jgi:hypothetical protein
MSSKRDGGAGSNAIEAKHRTLARSLTIERFAKSDLGGDHSAAAEATGTGDHGPSTPDPGAARVSRRKYRGWTLASRRYR